MRRKVRRSLAWKSMEWPLVEREPHVAEQLVAGPLAVAFRGTARLSANRGAQCAPTVVDLSVCMMTFSWRRSPRTPPNSLPHIELTLDFDPHLA